MIQPRCSTVRSAVSPPSRPIRSERRPGSAPRRTAPHGLGRDDVGLWTPERVAQALCAHGDLARDLACFLIEVCRCQVQRCVARGLVKPQDREDVCQDVLVHLYSDDARSLRRWDPSRGAGLKGFVGLIAYRRAIAVARAGWSRVASETTAEVAEDTLDDGAPRIDARIADRQRLAQVRLRVERGTSQQGAQLFEDFFIAQRSVAEICRTRGIKEGAVYTWRCRLRKLVQEEEAGTTCDSR